MNYKKITDDIFIPETTSPEPVKLSSLIAERDILVSQLQMAEPDSNELLAWAKAMHPFYLNDINAAERIDSLNTLISELQKL